MFNITNLIKRRLIINQFSFLLFYFVSVCALAQTKDIVFVSNTTSEEDAPSK